MCVCQSIYINMYSPICKCHQIKTFCCHHDMQVAAGESEGRMSSVGVRLKNVLGAKIHRKSPLCCCKICRKSSLYNSRRYRKTQNSLSCKFWYQKHMRHMAKSWIWYMFIILKCRKRCSRRCPLANQQVLQHLILILKFVLDARFNPCWFASGVWCKMTQKVMC